MSITLRGRATALASVPKHWRGPLPDLSVTRCLDPLDGFAKVPVGLLTGGFSDLAVVTWALIRLSFDERPDVASYRDFADALGLGDLTDGAIEQRFRAALQPLLGTWIKRATTERNQRVYQAICPKGADQSRYAMLRRSEFARLSLDGPRRHERMTIPDLADFARWQLECGRRGWTADPLSAIAGRWGVGHATLRRSRDRLVEAGLLKVVSRPGGRFTDLVWLQEIFDPHWSLPSASMAPEGSPRPALSRANSRHQSREVEATQQGRYESETRGSSSDQAGVVQAIEQGMTLPSTRGPIRNLSEEVLTEDLSGLGGAVAPPLTSVTRVPDDATPQAAPSKPRDVAARAPVHGLACRLIAPHTHLTSAPPHFRAAMLRRIGRALTRGLHPGHISRALDLVTEEQQPNDHCALVRLALQQAWSDQQAGACWGCGLAAQEHRIGCPVRAAAAEASDQDPDAIRHAILISIEQAGNPEMRPASTPAQSAATIDEDPLQRFLFNAQSMSGTSPTGDTELTAWFASKIASSVIGAADRQRAIQKAWSWWRARTPPNVHPALWVAVLQLNEVTRTRNRRAS